MCKLNSVEEEKQILIENLARMLLKIKAIRIGAFNTSSGGVTPYFIDLKPLPSFPDAFSLGVQCFEYEIHEEIEGGHPFDCFCGVQTGGLVFASALALRSKRPLVYSLAREAEKNNIRGFISPGTRVLVIDDVSETGVSIKSAADAIRSLGGEVENALTLIDRVEGASGMLKNAGITLHSFTTIRKLADALKEKMAMSEEEEKAIEFYA